MNYADIKVELNVTSLDLAYPRDANGVREIDPNTKEPYLWLSNFNNSRRVRIVMHENVATAITNDEPTNLAIKTSVKKGGKGDYTEHMIIQYKNTEIDFSL